MDTLRCSSRTVQVVKWRKRCIGLGTLAVYMGAFALDGSEFGQRAKPAMRKSKPLPWGAPRWSQPTRPQVGQA